MFFIDLLRLPLETVAGLLNCCLLLRALMQWVRIHPHNPLAPFVFSMTNWLVKPLRKAVPGYAGLDCASILGAFLVSFVLHILLALLLASLGVGSDGLGSQFTLIVSVSIVWVLLNAIYVLMGIIFIQVVLSWISPSSPVSAMLSELSNPFLQPLRRRLPTIGHVDLSPLIFLLILQIVMMILQRLMPNF